MMMTLNCDCCRNEVAVSFTLNTQEGRICFDCFVLTREERAMVRAHEGRVDQ